MNLMIKKLFQNYRFIGVLWFGLSFVAVLQTAFRPEKHNNYLIFKGVFWHTIQQLPLYVPYPEEYFDMNHYGIFFSGIIAPFAVLPNWLGCSLWILANSVFLYWAIRQLPLPKWAVIGVLFISVHDLYTAAAMQQFNVSIIALLLGAFVFIEKGKSHWATLFIVIGLLTKLYGIVGLAFCQRQMAFCVVWTTVARAVILFANALFLNGLCDFSISRMVYFSFGEKRVKFRHLAL